MLHPTRNPDIKGIKNIKNKYVKIMLGADALAPPIKYENAMARR